MRIDTIKRLSKEELASTGEQIPKWFSERAMLVINDFMEKIGQAVRGNITAYDNMLCKDFVGEFTSGTALDINASLDGRAALRPYGVWPINCAGANLTAFQWESLQNGKIRVLLTFDPAVTAKVTLRIELR